MKKWLLVAGLLCLCLNMIMNDRTIFQPPLVKAEEKSGLDGGATTTTDVADANAGLQLANLDF